MRLILVTTQKLTLMSKSKFFTGQPIFSQLLSFIPRAEVDRIARQNGSDRYCKRFTTYGHLVSMLYAVFNNCHSIREVTSGLLAWEHRIRHLGINYFPRRSTLSDANSRRSEQTFEKIYELLYNRYSRHLPDSRKKKSKLYIADSTTISLFQEILPSAGRRSVNGKRKGGIKVHTLIKSDEDVPCMIRYTCSAAQDVSFLKDITLPEGSILVFDKGYNDYRQFNRFSDEKITWITRKRDSAVHSITEKRPISEHQFNRGVRKDNLIILGHHQFAHNKYVKARLIHYTDMTSGRKFEFITNNTSLAASTISEIYKKRWQIEILFKRLKQNYPLQYFLGDSENAIKIQVWCALIADLLIKNIKSVAAQKWSFSNLTSIIRIHLMTYINLFSFLRNPEKALLQTSFNEKRQGLLFQT
jgi:hypothetical protein